MGAVPEARWSRARMSASMWGLMEVPTMMPQTLADAR